MPFRDTTILTIFASFWLAVLGAVMGSFLACAVDRWAEGELWLTGRSHCDACEQTLGVLDLIPVFSYLLCRGRCRYCGAPIPPVCLVAELAGTVALGSVGLRFGASMELAQWVVFAVLLLALSLADHAKRILPDALLLLLLINRLIWFVMLAEPPVETLFGMLKACAIPAALLALVLLAERALGREVMGGGDIKLLFVFAAYLTWTEMLLALLAACLLGLLAAAIAGKRRGVTIVFGPALAAGALLTVCYGGGLIGWYTSLF